MGLLVFRGGCSPSYTFPTHEIHCFCSLLHEDTTDHPLQCPPDLPFPGYKHVHDGTRLFFGEKHNSSFSVLSPPLVSFLVMPFFLPVHGARASFWGLNTPPPPPELDTPPSTLLSSELLPFRRGSPRTSPPAHSTPG